MSDWQPIETAPKDGKQIILLLGECLPNVPEVRTAQWVSRLHGEQLGESFSKLGGWLIWNSSNDWFCVPFDDARGWMPLPPPPNPLHTEAVQQ